MAIESGEVANNTPVVDSGRGTGSAAPAQYDGRQQLVQDAAVAHATTQARDPTGRYATSSETTENTASHTQISPPEPSSTNEALLRRLEQQQHKIEDLLRSGRGKQELLDRTVKRLSDEMEEKKGELVEYLRGVGVDTAIIDSVSTMNDSSAKVMQNLDAFRLITSACSAQKKQTELHKSQVDRLKTENEQLSKTLTALSKPEFTTSKDLSATRGLVAGAHDGPPTGKRQRTASAPPGLLGSFGRGRITLPASVLSTGPQELLGPARWEAKRVNNQGANNNFALANANLADNGLLGALGAF